MKRNIVLAALLIVLAVISVSYSKNRKFQNELVNTVYLQMSSDLRNKSQSLKILIDYLDMMNIEAIEKAEPVIISDRERILLAQLSLRKNYNSNFPESWILNELDIQWSQVFGQLAGIVQLNSDMLVSLINELKALDILMTWQVGPDSLVIDIERIILQLSKVKTELERLAF